MLSGVDDFPSVSVVIPAYNAEKSIGRAIESVLAQTHRADEIIVVDDGSTDATAECLKGFRPDIRIVTQPNIGASRSRNRGILEARSEYVAFLDADDYWSPEKLARQVALLQTESETGFVSCCAAVESADGEILGEWRFEESNMCLLRHLFVRHAGIPGSLSAVVIKRSLFSEIGLFDVDLTSQEDIDMWIRLASRTRFACVDEVLATITRQSGSVSSNFESMLSCARKVMTKHRGLLRPGDRNAFWRAAYSAMLTDYAKWAYRDNKTWGATWLCAEAALRSAKHWRLIASLLLAMARREDF